MATKSHSGAVRAPCPADAPSTRHTRGTTPDSSARPRRSPGRRPTAASVTRWPAPSSSITSGTRSWRASWHRRKRLSEAPLPIEPPSTVTSSAPARVGRPLMRPEPATRASAGTGGSSVVPTRLPISKNVPGSNRRSRRSRALSRPRWCWRTKRASPPMASASALRRAIASRAGPHPWSPSPISRPAERFVAGVRLRSRLTSSERTGRARLRSLVERYLAEMSARRAAAAGTARRNDAPPRAQDHDEPSRLTTSSASSVARRPAAAGSSATGSARARRPPHLHNGRCPTRPRLTLTVGPEPTRPSAPRRPRSHVLVIGTFEAFCLPFSGQGMRTSRMPSV